MSNFEDKLKAVMGPEQRLLQGTVMVVLVAGLGLVLYAIRNRQMEFVYSLF